MGTRSQIIAKLSDGTTKRIFLGIRSAGSIHLITPRNTRVVRSMDVIEARQKLKPSKSKSLTSLLPIWRIVEPKEIKNDNTL